MRFQARTLFTLVVVAVAAYAVVSAREWPLGTRLFPMVIGLSVLTLSLVQLFLDFYLVGRGSKANRKEDTGDLQVDWSVGSRVIAAKAAEFFGWLLGFFFCIWIFGFFVAVPLYGFLYLKFEAKEGWWSSFTLTVGVFVFFVGLFDQILHLPWPTPLIEAPEEIIRGAIPVFFE